MNLPTMEKDKEDFYQQFFEAEISQPLAKQNSSNVDVENEESSFIKKFGKRIVSNLLILVGGWMIFSSISGFFYWPANHPLGGLKMLLSNIVTIVIGLLLLFLGVGKIRKKSDWLLYAIFPLMGYISSLLLRFLPINLWHEGNFFSVLLSSFLLALFIFYYIKDWKQPSN
jgi:hypothetical protein